MASMSDRAQIARGEFYTEAELRATPRLRSQAQPASRAGKISDDVRLNRELAANNYAYADGKLTRHAWVERNRELVAESATHGVSLVIVHAGLVHLPGDIEPEPEA